MTAETLRVRNAARAHAAGEMSLKEYRRIRREAIAAFGSEQNVPAAADPETTQRRWTPEDDLVEQVIPEERPRAWWKLLALKTVIVVLVALWLL